MGPFFLPISKISSRDQPIGSSMRLGIILQLAFFISCSSPEISGRKLASSSPRPVSSPKSTQIDFSRSIVKIFPAVANNDGIWYFFYIQLKDNRGNFIDCDPSEISIKTHKEEEVGFTFQKLLTGRYYLTIEKTALISSTQLNVFIRDKQLKGKFKLYQDVPVRGTSSLRILRNDSNILTIELRLSDKDKRPIETFETPEILLDGEGEIEELRPISEGLWQFRVIYPEENQILYFSVRSQGVLLPNLLRFQHVEK